ncbi:MAG: ribose 5-phosphate isomerase A [Alphaproteobacteria bacterium]|nr:ribose 5-phosphate isomerase A [Alphaproteobacteria bacterium]
MSKWQTDKSSDLVWCRPISAREQKEAVAERLSRRLKDGDVVGIGSGSTSFLTLLALARRAAAESLSFTAIATSIEIERVCAALGVPTASLACLRPDWNFDGADEVDPVGRLIKGRGGAMFREKLVMAASLERYIVVDESKMVSRLGEKFAVPVEVVPEAVDLVRQQLAALGAVASDLRLAASKDGPVVTEFGGIILDVRFKDAVPSEQALESLPGVVATGLFDGWKYTRVAAD